MDNWNDEAKVVYPFNEFLDFTAFREQSGLPGREVNPSSSESTLNLENALACMMRDAMEATNIDDFIGQAVQLLEDALRMEYVTWFELQPDGQTLVLKAGTGWDEALMGAGQLEVPPGSITAKAFFQEAPLSLDQLRRYLKFQLPHLFLDQKLVSGISLPVTGTDGIFGILGVFSKDLRRLDEQELIFLDVAASVLGHALEWDWLAHPDQSQVAAQPADKENSRLMFRLDSDLRYLDVNPAFEKALGLSRDSLLGKMAHELPLPPEVTTSWFRFIRQAFRNPSQQDLDLELPGPEGVVLYQCRVQPETGPNGAIRSFLVTAHPVEFPQTNCQQDFACDLRVYRPRAIH